MEHYKHLCVYGPVVQVADVTFKDELECSKWAYLILVFSIQTFQEIFISESLNATYKLHASLLAPCYLGGKYI